MPQEAKINLFLMINVTVTVKLKQLYSKSQCPGQCGAEAAWMRARGPELLAGWTPRPHEPSAVDIRPTFAEPLPRHGCMSRDGSR